jgi:hypothetical protein
MRKVIGTSYGIILCSCLFTHPHLGRAIENEIWISPVGPAVTNINPTGYTNYSYPNNIVGTPTYPFRCTNGLTLNTVLTNVLLNATNITIHLMAGTFSLGTNYGGSSGKGYSIVPGAGWKIRGAGIDNTILQLGPSNNVGTNAFAIIANSAPTSSSPQVGVEVSDLTIDCNTQNQQTNFPSIAAINLAGDNCRISRVKAINWGAAGTECFVLNIQGANSVYSTNSNLIETYGTNLVIEDCEVTQLAGVMQYLKTNAGATAISIWTSGLTNMNLDIDDAIMRNNLVHDIQVGTGLGRVKWLNAYSGGQIVGHNRARNIVGGSGYYWDDWFLQDIVIEDNTFDNISYGVNFSSQGFTSTNIVIKNNLIRPATGGYGMYFTGGNTNNNLILKDNIIFPSDGVANTWGLSVGSLMTLTAMGNILQGGGTGYDVGFLEPVPNWNNWQYNTNRVLGINAWLDNVNLSGTQLNELPLNNQPQWLPGTQDTTIAFVATNAGWWRVVSNYAYAAGSVTVSSAEWNSVNYSQSTDLDFNFLVMGWRTNSSQLGYITETRQGNVSVTRSTSGRD